MSQIKQIKQINLQRPLLRSRLLCLTTLVALLSACGAQDFDPKSLFVSYRVIGIQAEPPTLSLTGESTLSVYDFHPSDLTEDEERPEVSYSWRLCPFTLGSMVQYECFLDELELEPNEDGTVTVSTSALAEQAAELMALFSDGGQMLGPQGMSAALGAVDVYVKLSAQVEGADPIEVVKRLTLNISPEAPSNANPSFEAEAIIVEEAAAGLKVGEELTLTAQVAAEASERYTPLAPEGEEPMEREEELIIGWSTTAGELNGPFSLIDDPSTKLTLPDEPQNVRVFVTVRDGRGGLDVRSLDIEVTE